jgi:hypothetical protein
MPSAAWREARILSTVDEGRQRPQSENQHEKYGEAAPHLQVMLSETEARKSGNVMTLWCEPRLAGTSGSGTNKQLPFELRSLCAAQSLLSGIIEDIAESLGNAFSARG